MNATCSCWCDWQPPASPSSFLTFEDSLRCRINDLKKRPQSVPPLVVKPTGNMFSAYGRGPRGRFRHLPRDELASSEGLANPSNFPLGSLLRLRRARWARRRLWAARRVQRASRFGKHGPDARGGLRRQRWPSGARRNPLGAINPSGPKKEPGARARGCICPLSCLETFERSRDACRRCMADVKAAIPVGEGSMSASVEASFPNGRI